MVKKKKVKDATTEALGLDWSDETDYESHGLVINDPDIAMSEDEKKKKYNYTMKTGAPKKYTLEWCREEVKGMVAYLNTPVEDKDKEAQRRSVLFIEELCIRGGYAPQRWSEWKKAYANDEEFSEATKMVEAILEIRLAKAGLGGKANPIMSIFALKVKYGWREPDQQIQQPTQLPFDQLFFLKHGRYPTVEELRQFGIVPVQAELAPPTEKSIEDEFREITDHEEEVEGE